MLIFVTLPMLNYSKAQTIKYNLIINSEVYLYHLYIYHARYARHSIIRFNGYIIPVSLVELSLVQLVHKPLMKFDYQVIRGLAYNKQTALLVLDIKICHFRL